MLWMIYDNDNVLWMTSRIGKICIEIQNLLSVSFDLKIMQSRKWEHLDRQCHLCCFQSQAAATRIRNTTSRVTCRVIFLGRLRPHFSCFSQDCFSENCTSCNCNCILTEKHSWGKHGKAWLECTQKWYSLRYNWHAISYKWKYCS